MILQNELFDMAASASYWRSLLYSWMLILSLFKNLFMKEFLQFLAISNFMTSYLGDMRGKPRLGSSINNQTENVLTTESENLYS